MRSPVAPATRRPDQGSLTARTSTGRMSGAAASIVCAASISAAAILPSRWPLRPSSSWKVSNTPKVVALWRNANQVTVCSSSRASLQRVPQHGLDLVGVLGLGFDPGQQADLGHGALPWGGGRFGFGGGAVAPAAVRTPANLGGRDRSPSVASDASDTVSVMDIAVLAYDGVFDSGLAAILDVLDGANAMRAELPQPPPAWEVTTVGFRRRVRTGAGHVVTTAPVAEAEKAGPAARARAGGAAARGADRARLGTGVRGGAATGGGRRGSAVPRWPRPVRAPSCWPSRACSTGARRRRVGGSHRTSASATRR